MVWTGNDISVESIKDGVQTGVENVKDKVFETKLKVNEIVEEKTKDQLNKVLPKN
jgi:hypothetical protein